MADFSAAAFAGLLIGLFVGVIIIHPVAYFSGRNDMKQEILNRGLAGYCPANGVWAFNGECE